MGDELLGDNLKMALPVLLGATDAEYDVARPGIDEFLTLTDAILHGPEQTMLEDEFKELATVEVGAAKLLGCTYRRQLLGGISES